MLKMVNINLKLNFLCDSNYKGENTNPLKSKKKEGLSNNSSKIVITALSVPILVYTGYKGYNNYFSGNVNESNNQPIVLKTQKPKIDAIKKSSVISDVNQDYSECNISDDNDETLLDLKKQTIAKKQMTKIQ